MYYNLGLLGLLGLKNDYEFQRFLLRGNRKADDPAASSSFCKKELTLSGTPNIIWIKNIHPFAIVGTETLTPAFCKTCRTCGIEIKPLNGRREGWLCRKGTKARGPF